MHPDVQEKVNQLVEKLRAEFDDNLISVCVYGSSILPLSTTYRGKHRDINVLVVFRQLELDQLERATAVSRWWKRVGRSVPILLSEEEWRRSSDVFALEYADIRDNHYLAYGQDLYSHLEVDCQSLRLILELELHRKLLYLREKYIQLGPRHIQQLMKDGVTSFAALFRGVLRLLRPNEMPPMNAWDVFEKLSTLHLAGYDAKPFLKILEIKESGYSPRSDETLELCEQFIRQITLITQYVDQYQQESVDKKEKVRV